jgi:hypothetical protein
VVAPQRVVSVLVLYLVIGVLVLALHVLRLVSL